MMNSARLYVILTYAIILTLIKGDYFNGGTLTYRVMRTYRSQIVISVTQTYLYNYSEVYCDDKMIEKQLSLLVHKASSNTFNCSRHCNRTGEFLQSVPITSLCTGYSKSLDITIGQRMDFIGMTVDFPFLIVLRSGSWRRLSLPIALTEPFLWSVTSSVMLRQRSNGEYNSPPVATIVSPIYIPVGILQEIVIPTIDIDDGDEVRCRFAGDIDECGDICYSASLPIGTKLLSNCKLLITGQNIGDWYGITIIVEDFLDSKSTNPLSSIPIQFLIHVQNKNTCRSPPHLTGPLLQSGQCMSVLVNELVIIQLKVENFCSNTTTIQDIVIISFPNVIKKPIVQNTTSIWLVSLMWMPTEEQIGPQILCAVAIDSNHFQSNQYCITFTVANESILPCPSDRNKPISMTTTKTVLSLVRSINTFGSLKIFSASAPNDEFTHPITKLSSSDSSSHWLWISPLISVLAACLIVLCIWCCCYYKQRQKPPPTKRITPQGHLKQPPKTYKVYNVSKNETNTNINNNQTPTSPVNNVQHPTSTSQSESYLFGNRHH